MSRVRAKFNVTRIESSIYQTTVPKNGKDGAEGYDTVKKEMRTIVMHPVYSSDPGSENRLFWDSSPSGELKLGTVNPEAWGRFELGRDYYLDFTPAD